MSVSRLRDIPGFNIDRVAAAAGDDPDVLRMENLDTDVPPPAAAIAATRRALGEDEANSWLPFTGRDDLKERWPTYVERRGGPRYDGPRRDRHHLRRGRRRCSTRCSCLTDPGDEVILTDPTYAGMLNRVRLVGAVPRLVPLARRGRRVAPRPGRRCGAAAGARTRVVFVNNAVLPDRLGRERRGVGGPRRPLPRARPVAPVLGRLRGHRLRRPARPHPAALPGMRDRTVTVGAPSFEQRMIAWRVGWVVAPGALVNDVSRVQIYNGLVSQRLRPGRRARGARRAAATIWPPPTPSGSGAATRRCASSRGLPAVRPAGAWSLLLDVAALGLDSRRGLSPAARAEGRRHAHAWLGRRGRRAPRPIRLQQRARRTAHEARRACSPGARVRSRRDLIGIGAVPGRRTPRLVKDGGGQKKKRRRSEAPAPP